jgi:hypothetical protein
MLYMEHYFKFIVYIIILILRITLNDIMIILFLQMENCGTKRLSDLLKIKQLFDGKDINWNHIAPVFDSMELLTIHKVVVSRTLFF